MTDKEFVLTQQFSPEVFEELPPLPPQFRPELPEHVRLALQRAFDAQDMITERFINDDTED